MRSPEDGPQIETTLQVTESFDINDQEGAGITTETAPEAALPLSSGLGVRPAEAVLHRAVDPDLEPAIEWRPPPVPVPHSLHPDDHYWLARPLPSDSRNYDLEWYAFGNRPMISQALPYRVHHGMDFPNDTGTPIFAASSGEVIWAGPLPSNRDGVNYYGNTVIIKHDWQWLGQDVYTLYAHTLELFVEVGDQVEQGQLIAGVGASGEVSGPHLHLEVRVGENNYNAVRNPVLWLAPYEGWGVLAGRFMDERGRLIHGAQVTVIPIAIDGNIEVPTRRQRTYEPSGVQSDDVWGENFVVGDLPAGLYRVVLTTAGETFRREVRIKPEMTNFVIFQADFTWAPTYTPTPTPTSTPTPPLSREGTPTPP
jgi:murein DD-endopeptidase MepM/ murein hydrolase activator NlpD